MVDFADVGTLAAGYHRRGGQPGLAYGIVIGGELVHAAGLGERHLGGPPPDADTVFRIRRQGVPIIRSLYPRCYRD